MKIEILTTVEDANEFPLDEPLAVVQPYTIGHRRYRWHIARVDKLRAGLVVDLPQSQAENLVRLGYARTI